jgi:hypothetical protein
LTTIKNLIDTRVYFHLRAKNSILRNKDNRFYILDHKNKQSIRYYFHLGNLTIFACKKNVYDDVCLILEKLGLPSITKDEFSLIQKKMKDHEKKIGMYSRAMFSCPLDFESKYIAEDLDWD